MNTIRDYLENMFAGLPKTVQIEQLKEELAVNMEEKYHELKASGKTENEAIGIVISEFGNVDEIIQELGIEIEDGEEVRPSLTESMIEEFLHVHKKASFLIGLGVFLTLVGTSLLILLYQLIDEGYFLGLSSTARDLIGLIPLLSFVAIATGMFIYASMIINPYKDLESDYSIDPVVKKSLIKRNDSYQSRFMRAVTIGIILVILSPLSLFVVAVLSDYWMLYGVIGLLLMVASAVFIMIYFGGIKLSYMRLLKTGSYSKETTKVINAVSAIIWPLAVLIFLISGLVYQLWYINWIIFVIAGILFGMFSETYRILKEK